MYPRKTHRELSFDVFGYKHSAVTSRQVAFAVFGVAIAAVLNGACLRYVIEFWAPHVIGNSVAIPLLPAIAASFVLRGYAVHLALLTWVLSYCL